MRVLAFASEPWEIEMMAGVLCDSSTFGAQANRKLAICDTYTILYHGEWLKRIEASLPFPVATLQQRYRRWQAPGPPPRQSLDVSQWAKSYCAARSVESIISSNQYLDAWERATCYLKLDPEWKRFIVSDILDWTTSVIDEFQPDLILSIERRTMPVNAAQAIADARGIQMLTLTQSRIGSRWVVRTDMGRGFGVREAERLSNVAPTTAELAAVQEIRARVADGRPLYESFTHEASDSLEHARSSRLRSTLSRITSAAHDAAYRHLRGGKRERGFVVRRYEQAFWGLTWWQLRQTAGQIRFTWGGYRILRRAVPSGPFVLWMLHARPEESVSAIGDGLDEFSEVLWLRANLPPGMALVVKENALMLGQRRSGFYEDLRKNGVELVSPTVPGGSLISRSVGIAGLSGTALLEAAVLNKPTLAFGHPEFLPCLTAQGRAGLNQFLDAITTEDPRNLEETVTRYIVDVLRNSDPADLPFLADAQPHEKSEFIRSVAMRFWKRSLEHHRDLHSPHRDQLRAPSE